MGSRTVVDCDIEECKRSNAKSFSFFKERRQDAAGSMENWHYSFDLCEIHKDILLNELLSFFEKTHKSDLVSIAKKFRIRMTER